MNSGQTDLLYSVKTGAVEQAAPVLLNFRHAMSYVKVMLASNNPQIEVKVSHVGIRNIYTQGTFDFPMATTSASTPEVTGSWTNLKNPTGMMTFYAVSKEDVVTLTPTFTDYGVNNLEVNFFIPQPLAELSNTGTDFAGNYLQVDCEIFDKETGVKLWPNDRTPSYLLIQATECGRLVFPVTSENVKEWKIGHAYIYNVSIDNPDVLGEIKFDVTVDQFTIDEL